MVVLSVERSLEARADRSRGSIGGSSASGDGSGAGSHAQPSARAAVHAAITNVNIPPALSRQPPAPTLPTLPRTLLPNASVSLNTGPVQRVAHWRRSDVTIVRSRVRCGTVRGSRSAAGAAILNSVPGRRRHALAPMFPYYRHYR